MLIFLTSLAAFWLLQIKLEIEQTKFCLYKQRTFLIDRLYGENRG